jgi:putative SOS response-associated peptidase YedK
MCGRFTLTTAAELVAEAFGLEEVPALSPRINISPTEDVAVVRTEEAGGPRLSFLKWGFETPKRRPLINARAETLFQRSAFRDAFARRRCLVPADGFYEWPIEEGRKHAVWIRRPDRKVFAFAGLWEPGADGKPDACTLVTTVPTKALASVHDRMPVILPPEDYARWLEVGVRDPRTLTGLLLPRETFPLEVVEAPPLSRAVR